MATTRDAHRPLDANHPGERPRDHEQAPVARARRPRQPLPRLCALALALLALSGAAHAGSPKLLHGQRAWGILVQPGEQDEWLIDAVAGSALSMSVRTVKKDGLLPALEVYDLEADAEVLPTEKQLKGLGKPSINLAKLILPSTGTYALRVRSTNDATGSYKLNPRLTPPAGGKLKQVLELGPGGSGFVAFDALPASPATISVSPGADVIVNSLTSPGGFVPISQVLKGKQRRVYDLEGKTLVLSELGTYFLQVSNQTAEPLAATVLIKLKRAKLPKGQKTPSETVGTVSFVTPASLAPAEKAPGKGHPVELVLSLPEGVVLPGTVKVPLMDAGTGSATSGKDYAPLTKAKAGFAKGAVDGSSATAYVKLKNDALAEGDETLDLGLGAGNFFVAPEAKAAHVITIVDSDPQPRLDVRLGGAEGPILSSGESVALGSAPLYGTGAPTLIALTNEGTATVTLFPPRLPAGLRDFQVTEVQGLNAPPGAPPAPPGVLLGSPLPAPPAAPLPAPAPPHHASPAAPAPALAAWDPDAERTLRLPTASSMPSGLPGRLLPHHELALDDDVRELVLLDLPLPTGGLTELVLTRRELPYRASSRLDLDGVPVPGGPLALLDEHSLWSGTVAGRPDTAVFVGISRGAITGWIDRPEGRVHLMPRRGVDGTWHAPRTAVMDESQVQAVGMAPPAFTCDARLPGDLPWEPGDDQSPPAPPPPPPGTSPDGLPFLCRMAIETDVELLASFDGNVQAMLGYVTNLWGAVSLVYEQSVNTEFTLAYVGVHTTGSDPWFAGDSSGRLNEFRAAWANNFPVDADLAHMLSSADLGGGVAYGGVICDQAWGFAVSGGLWTSVATGLPGGGGPITWDVVVTAHETGHNFGAPHTHDVCPTPLDNCAAAEYAGACQAFTGICQLGTIMSYCHLCGGMESISFQFHEHMQGLMSAHVAQSCLLAPRYLDPGDVHAFTLSFKPVSGWGAKADTLVIEHDAYNQPEPYELGVTGTAQ